MTWAGGSERLMIVRYSIVAAIVNFALWAAYRATNHDPASAAGSVVMGVVAFGQGLLLAISLAIAQTLSDKECLKFSSFKLVNIAVAQAVLTGVAGFGMFLPVPSTLKYVFLVSLSTLFGGLLALCAYRTSNRLAPKPLLGIGLVSVVSPIALMARSSLRILPTFDWTLLAVAFVWHIPLSALIAAWLSSSATSSVNVRSRRLC